MPPDLPALRCKSKSKETFRERGVEDPRGGARTPTPTGLGRAGGHLGLSRSFRGVATPDTSEAWAPGWLGQLSIRLGSGPDLTGSWVRVLRRVSMSPASGKTGAPLGMSPASLSLSLSLTLCPSLTCAVSKKKKKQKGGREAGEEVVPDEHGFPDTITVDVGKIKWRLVRAIGFEDIVGAETAGL